MQSIHHLGPLQHSCTPPSAPSREHRLKPTAWALRVAIATLAPALAWAQPASGNGALQAATQQLPQVDVVDEMDRVPGAAVVLDAHALEQAASMKDVVRNLPLVAAPGTAAGTTRNRSSFDRSGTTGYNIRGIEGNRIGMDVDGVEMPDATTRPWVSRAGVNTFGVGRDFIDPEMFSQANIQSGTTAAKRSAGGIGGAVSFKTKSASDYLREGKTSHASAKIGYDTADRSWNESVTAAGRSGDLDGLIAYSRRDGHATRNNSSTVDSAPDNWHSDALLLKGGLRIDATQKLELSADLYRRKNDTAFYGWNTANTTITDNSQQASDTARSTLQMSHQWTPANSAIDMLDTRLFVQDTQTKDITDTTTIASGAKTRSLSQNDTRTWGISSNGYKRIERHQLSFGANASTQDTERPWSVSGYMKPQPDTTTDRVGAFIQDDIAFDLAGKRLAIIPALRGDRVQIKTRNLENFASGALTQQQIQTLYGNTPASTIWSPSLGLTYDLAPKLLAFAQYKRSGRAPSAGEIFGSWNITGSSAAGYGLVGNSNLKEETSNAFEMGVKGSPTPGVTLSTSAFYTRYTDFIAYTRYTRAGNPAMFTNIPSQLSIIYQAENRDQATIYGLDLNSRLEHGQWSPALKGLYTTWAMGLSKGTSRSRYDGDTDVPLDSVLPNKAVIGVGFDAPMKHWGMNLTGTFVKGKQAVATNRDSYNNSGTPLTSATTALFRVPGYASFDLTGYWQISKNMRVQAGIYNLTDKRYWDYASARSLQPSVARDQSDMELLTNPGRTVAVSLAVSF